MRRSVCKSLYRSVVLDNSLGGAEQSATLETRRKLDRVSFRNEFWDRYWGRANQLLANVFPCPQ